MSNVELWAAENNLKLNKSKSKEIIFYNPRSAKNHNIEAIADIPGVERVSEIKCLGVTLNSNFSISNHIAYTLSACSSNLFALYLLRSKGLSPQHLQTIFQASILSKLLYTSQFWWGFTSAQDRVRLEAFLKKAKKANFYTKNSTFQELCVSADERFFNNICANPNHLLHRLLPQQNNHNYSTRRNVANRTFQFSSQRTALDDKSYITRMLLKDSNKI